MKMRPSEIVIPCNVLIINHRRTLDFTMEEVHAQRANPGIFQKEANSWVWRTKSQEA